MTTIESFKGVRVTLRVKSDAHAATLKSLAQYSPVYDIVSNSLPVELLVQKA